MKKSIIYSLIAFLLSSISLTVNAEKIKVACMGNSITAGDFNYPTALKSMMSDGYDVRGFGLGGSGIFIEDRYAQDGNYNTVYERTKQCADALAFNPDIVIIKLGTNDSGNAFWYSNAWGDLPEKADAEAHFKADYMSLIAKVQALPSKPRIILCYPVHLYSWGMFWNGAKMNETLVNKIRPIINEIAEEQNFEVIDLDTPTTFPLLYGPNDTNKKEPYYDAPYGIFAGDGCHPNLYGAFIIAKVVYEAITKVPFTFEGRNIPFVPESSDEPYYIVSRSGLSKDNVVVLEALADNVKASLLDKKNLNQQFKFENFTCDEFQIRTNITMNNSYRGKQIPIPTFLSYQLTKIAPKMDGSALLCMYAEKSNEEGFFFLENYNYPKTSRIGLSTEGGLSIVCNRKPTDTKDLNKWAFVKVSEIDKFIDNLTNGNSERLVSIASNITVEENNIVIRDITPSVRISVYNISGQMVYSKVAINTFVSIPVEKGSYIVSVDNKSAKIMVE